MLPFAAGCDLLENGTEPTPIGREVVYDALGASDTIGYGSSNPCLPLIDCTTGPGYVQQVTRRLQADGRQVSLRNHGWPGAVLSPETQALLQSMGGCQAQGTDVCRNLLLEGAPYVRRSATLVTMFIGANDVNAIGRAVRSGRTGGLDQAAFIQSQIEKFARDIQEAATTIRSRAPEARLIVLNLPNMANTPYASGFTVAEKRVLQQLSVGFSAGINALAGQNAVVVDLMCDGNFYNPALFSSDGFHPNDTGYNYLTERVYSAVTGSVTAPRSSCGFMTVF
ncbi:MAG: GDSL-type esterase/lipase family protein [Acidobacteriota bacterium]|jgi:lysophospholipase L1-like esterase